MNRREVLAAAGTVVATGCLKEITDENDPAASDAEQPDAGSEPRPEETDREVLREDELVVPDTRLPHEFEEGDEIVVEVRVDNGGPVTVLVEDRKQGRIIADKRVSTEATLTATAETTGNYWVWVREQGTAHITVARR